MIVTEPWTASAERTAAVTSPTAALIRGAPSVRLPLMWPAKSSADCLDYTVDLSAWLADTSDVVAGFSITAPAIVAPTDLVVLWASIIDGAPVAFLGGGAPGTTSTLGMTFTTAAGRRLTQLISIAITTDTAATLPVNVPRLATSGFGIPPNAIALPSGAILVNAAGLPFLLA